MRTAKLLLLLSLATLMLTASYVLLTEHLVGVRPARAQTADGFVSLVKVDEIGDSQKCLAITSDGQVFGVTMRTYQTAPDDWEVYGVSDFGHIFAGSVPTEPSSISDLKRKYGGD